MDPFCHSETKHLQQRDTGTLPVTVEKPITATKNTVPETSGQIKSQSTHSIKKGHKASKPKNGATYDQSLADASIDLCAHL